MKAARLQGARDVARGNLSQGIMVGEGERLSGTHVNSHPEVPEEEGHVKPQGVRKEPKEMKASNTKASGC